MNIQDPERREFVVDREVRIRPLNGIKSLVTLNAPSAIDDRRAFIVRLRDWADDLESEVAIRQASLDRLDAQIAARECFK